MKNDLIVIENKFNNAKFDLKSSEELKILAYAISTIQKTDDELVSVKIDLLNFTKLTGSIKKYSRIKKMASSIRKAGFFIPNENGWIEYSLFSSVEYKDNQGILVLRFNQDTKPYFLDMKYKQYTKYFLSNIAHLRSSYALRIYGLIKQKNELKKAIFNVKDLQNTLQCPDSYKNNYQIFKRKVLDISIKEINEKTDIYIYKIDYTKKIRKKIIEIMIYFRSKKDLNLSSLKEFITSIKRIYEGQELFKPSDYNILSPDGYKALSTTILSIKNGLLVRNTKKEHITQDESNYYYKAFYKRMLIKKNKIRKK